MEKLKASVILILCIVFNDCYSQHEKILINKPNILFIVVDDLRPELGCYGKQQMHTPNIDALAESGFIFNCAYCNIPVCGASRASVMSGIRPNRTRFLDYNSQQDKDIPGIVSLPMHFKNNGYKTVSLGKVYHYQYDGIGSWSEIPWRAWAWEYVSPESRKQIITHPWRDGVIGPSFECPDVPDHVYADGMLAHEAIAHLQELMNCGKPFFLAVGFHRPHLPFQAPKKYWDLYNFNEIELPDNMKKPKDAPDECMHNFSELRHYSNIPNEGPLDKMLMRKLIHGYYASVSYVDTQIGKVLNELERLGLAENTIVILWGDHGWFLGEHNMWCKHSNFEKALHSPLILRAPGRTEKNSKTDALVEFVDIYPSLCELAGLKQPFHLQGKSFVPLIEDPDQPWKNEIYCRWIRGETVITPRHTYTEWLSDQSSVVYARMLYDILEDPEETINISEKPENIKLVQKLSLKLKKHISERDRIIISSEKIYSNQ